jgi:long-chain acyl-CoA synthetase
MIEASLSDLTTWAASRFGDATALVIPQQATHGFADIDHRAGRVAGGLAAMGLVHGDRVVLHLPNSLEWIVAYHAIARLGGVVVPANILLSGEEVSLIAQDAEARLLIIPSDRDALFTHTGIPIISVGGMAMWRPFEELYQAELLPPVPRRPDDLFTIGYTSGTTGKPKGAMLSHGAIFASIAATATMHIRSPQDIVLSSLPFPHVYGNVVMNAVFLAGTRLVTTSRFEPGEALRLIGEHRVTLFEGVPTMYYQMLSHAGISEADLTSLTRCTVGGQTMPSAKIEAVVEHFGCPLLELWGMTEVGGPAITHSPFWPPRHGSIGFPVPGIEARIADLADPTQDVDPGGVGELMVRGIQVTNGYWNDEAATSSAIDVHGWLATGDIGRRDGQGYYYLVDRKKDLIITAGYNIYPAELEQVIAMHPAVAMVAVVGVEDAEKGELAWAFIVPYDNAKADDQDIITFCRARIASYKVPRRVLFVDTLPKTSTGKIMRSRLRDHAALHSRITP